MRNTQPVFNEAIKENMKHKNITYVEMLSKVWGLSQKALWEDMGRR